MSSFVVFLAKISFISYLFLSFLIHNFLLENKA